MRRVSSRLRPGVRIAAIDAGSNAIRLVIGEYEPNGTIKVLKKFREPVRLGKDVFARGAISKKTALKTATAFLKFRTELKNHQVELVRAVGTSALREAKNRDALVRHIELKSGIKIEVIDGLEEGRLIFSAVARHTDLTGKNSALIDIGGGSIEITFASGTKIRATQTFPLGTVRLLETLSARGLKEKHLQSVITEHLRPVHSYLRSALGDKPIDFAIGTGGNFECLGKLRVALLSKNSMHSMSYSELLDLTRHLAGMSIKERVRYLRLKPDRADVVVPAAMTTVMIMKMIPVDTLVVPFVGLRDGLLASIVESA